MHRIDIFSNKMISKSSASDTKEKILAVTLNLINKKGYDKVSTREIARNVKISDGTLYHHFKTGKIGILKEIVCRNANKILAIEFFNEPESEDFEILLRRFVLHHIKHHREDLAFNLAYEQAFLINKEIFKDLSTIFDLSIKIITQKLKKIAIFKEIEEEELFLRVKLAFDLLEAMTHRHIFISPVCKTDIKLADYLSRLMILTVTHNE
ncbi:MAG: TetR/AcrR family transcriptional regulator [Candidatus Hermodarchaeota archaeon]